MFGDKLKKLRTDNNLTQDELAEKIMVTRTAISKWETNRGYPSIDSLKELSKLFDISIDELIQDERLWVVPAMVAIDNDELEQKIVEKCRGYKTA